MRSDAATKQLGPELLLDWVQDNSVGVRRAQLALHNNFLGGEWSVEEDAKLNKGRINGGSPHAKATPTPGTKIPPLLAARLLPA